jgi:hypothetical protein
MTQKSNSTDLFPSKLQPMPQTNPKLARRASVSSTTHKQNQYIINQRRQNLSAINNNFFNQNRSSSLSVPLLIDIMNTFYQTAQIMEEEIMLPSKLKDMPVEGKIKSSKKENSLFIFMFLELVFDSSIQPDNWYEIYTFIRDMRNQLGRAHPFADDDEKETIKDQTKYPTDDEGIILSNHDNYQFSSASSQVSSDEFEQSSTSSVGTSYDTIKDELKYHYYGLFRSLDNLTSLANRVTEKYREDIIH